MSRRERLAAALLIAALFALRIVYAFHLEFDSDEPQHLHVVWAWTQGLLPYRDVFDNHAPLFHLACSPLLRGFGERADVLVLMRLALLPVFALTLAAVEWLGRALYSERVGLWGAVFAGLWPEHFLTSLEFRPDGLWSALWLVGLAVLVSGRLRPPRCAAAGLILGTALAVSLKTVLLLAALTLAAGIVLALVARRAAVDARHVAACAGAFLTGLLAIPVVVVLGFAASGALESLIHDTILHNLLPGARPGPGALIALAVLVLVPLALMARSVVTGSENVAIGARRALVLLASAFFLAGLKSFWPLLAPQDYLPFEPIAALFVAAALFGTHPTAAVAARGEIVRRTLAGLIVAGEITALVVGHPPARAATGPQITLLRDVLRLTRPGETVMDLKGEMVFRPRAFHGVLESVTRERLRRGLLADRIPERLIETRTAVVANDSHFLPPRARAFMDTNYVSVGSLRVLGRMLEPAGPGEPGGPGGTRTRLFTLAVPGRYAVVSGGGPAAGLLDGERYAGARELAAGPHRYLPAPGEDRVAVVWARAVETGYSPVPMKDQSP